MLLYFTFLNNILHALNSGQLRNQITVVWFLLWNHVHWLVARFSHIVDAPLLTTKDEVRVKGAPLHPPPTLRIVCLSWQDGLKLCKADAVYMPVSPRAGCWLGALRGGTMCRSVPLFEVWSELPCSLPFPALCINKQQSRQPRSDWTPRNELWKTTQQCHTIKTVGRVINTRPGHTCHCRPALRWLHTMQASRPNGSVILEGFPPSVCVESNMTVSDPWVRWVQTWGKL